MIKRIQNRFQQELYYLKKYNSNRKMARGHQVKFFNFWNTNISDNWFTNFLKARGFLDRYPDLTISIFSVYGPRYLIDLNRSDIKLFYNAENVFLKARRYHHYQDLAINKVDLAMGFRKLEYPNYARFPLWILHFFEPWHTEEDIRTRCDQLSYQKADQRERFAAHVSRHDDSHGIRSEIIKTLSKIDRVDSAGFFMRNTDELQKHYNDDKIEYLKNYKFNICPENSNNRYYVTEKIAHAIMAGCIPIYWGARGEPEPEIFNRESFIYWDGKDSTVKKIKDLHKHDSQFQKFVEQPRLKPGAVDKIIQMFNSLEDKLTQLFERHV